MSTLKNIISQRLKQLKISPITAAKSVGLERTYIRDLVVSNKESIRSDKIGLVAEALDLDPDALSRNELVPIDNDNSKSNRDSKEPEDAALSVDLELFDRAADRIDEFIRNEIRETVSDERRIKMIVREARRLTLLRDENLIEFEK